MSAKPGSAAAGFFLYFRPAMAEFFGTFFYVFIAISCRVDSMKVDAEDSGIVVCALGQGFCILLLVASLGWISGGHFNPGVTLAVFICGGIRWPFVIIYPLIQFLAAFLAGLVCWGVDKENAIQKAIGAYKGKAGHGLPMLPGVPNGLFSEVFFTLILVLAYLMCSDEANGTAVGPFAIGLAVAIGVFTNGHISGGCLNTADAFGRALAATAAGKITEAWKEHYIYWIGPLLGALLAVAFYKLIFASYANRWIVKEEAAG